MEQHNVVKYFLNHFHELEYIHISEVYKIKDLQYTGDSKL